MKTTILMAVVLATIISADETTSGNLTARDIMVKVDTRDNGDTRQSIMNMILTNKAGETRSRVIRSSQKDYGEDSKAQMIFLEPADVGGTGYLSYEYDVVGKDDNRWLYMPALRKIRRISGSSNDDYFMGSDFTYDDMGDRNVDEDTHALISSDVVNDYDCYKIKSTPVDEDDNYTEKTVWVRKDIFMTIKVEYFNDYGHQKTLSVSNIEDFSGVMMPRNMTMVNHEENHKTELVFNDIVVNNELDDNLFLPATLKRASARY